MTTEEYRALDKNRKEAGNKIQPLVDERDADKEKIKELTETISQLEAKVRDLEQNQIPDTLLEYGFPDGVFLPNGKTVQVKPFYFARVHKETTEEFYAWLRANGHGGLVKAHFQQWMTDPYSIVLLKKILSEFAISYELKDGVHWKQLEAWFKEQTLKGEDLPLTLFDNYIGRKAFIK